MNGLNDVFFINFYFDKMQLEFVRLKFFYYKIQNVGYLYSQISLSLNFISKILPFSFFRRLIFRCSSFPVFEDFYFFFYNFLFFNSFFRFIKFPALLYLTIYIFYHSMIIICLYMAKPIIDKVDFYTISLEKVRLFDQTKLLL